MTDNWNHFQFEAEVADVKRPFATVSKLCAAGNRVVFDPSGSYVENIRTGNKTAIECTGKGYRLKVWLPSFQRQGNP